MGFSCLGVRVSNALGSCSFPTSHLLNFGQEVTVGHPLVNADAWKMLCPWRKGTKRHFCCSSKGPVTTVTCPNCFCEKHFVSLTFPSFTKNSNQTKPNK